MSGLLSALGGGANGVVSLAAGGLSGVVAMSALIATGVVAVGPPATGPQPLALVDCPGSGSVVAAAQPGDQMLVTGRSADGSWLRIYVPGPAGDGWVPASRVNLLADGSTLPVAGCSQVAAATGSPAPTAMPTATPIPPPTASPTATAKPIAKPTAAPTASPTPTPTPNPGPRFTTQPYSDVATMNTNPLGTGSCAYALGTGLTTKATDADGVSAIQLWVRKPGATSYRRFSHDFTHNGATWNDFINAKDDGVTTAGTLSWYALAIDGTGAQTKSTVRSIKIVRCDTEASFEGTLLFSKDGPKAYHINFCYSPTTQPIEWRVLISDPDGVSGAKVSYVFARLDGQRSASGAVSLTNVSGGTWEGRSVSYDMLQYYGQSTVAWTIVSTDRYGGKSSYHEVDSLVANYC
jgi:hypothetical protein